MYQRTKTSCFKNLILNVHTVSFKLKVHQIGVKHISWLNAMVKYFHSFLRLFYSSRITTIVETSINIIVMYIHCYTNRNLMLKIQVFVFLFGKIVVKLTPFLTTQVLMICYIILYSMFKLIFQYYQLKATLCVVYT